MSIRQTCILLLVPLLAAGQAPMTVDQARPSVIGLGVYQNAFLIGNFSVTGVLNSATTARAICGPLWPSATSNSIAGVAVRYSTITAAGVGTFQIQLYPASTTVFPLEPNVSGGSLVGTGALTSNTTNLPANTWKQTNFTANYSGSPGTIYCAVWSYVSYSGSDAIGFTLTTAQNALQNYAESSAVHATGWGSSPVWTQDGGTAYGPILALAMADGSWGRLGSSVPLSSGTMSLTFSSSGVAEYSNAWTPANSAVIAGICTDAAQASSGPKITVYGSNGTTVLAANTLNAFQMSSNTAGVIMCQPFTSGTQLANGLYVAFAPAKQKVYLSYSNSTSTAITLSYMQNASTSLLSLLEGGSAMVGAHRSTAGSGAWTPDAGYRYSIYPMVIAWGNKGSFLTQQ